MASQHTRKTVKHLSVPQTKETLMPPSEGVCLPDTNQRGVSEGDRQLTSSNITQGQEPIADIDVDIGTPPTQIEESPQLRRSPRLQALQNKQKEHIALPSALEVGNSPYSIGDETDDMIDPIAFAAKTRKDTLYYHQAMKVKDSRQFQEAMQMEKMITPSTNTGKSSQDPKYQRDNKLLTQCGQYTEKGGSSSKKCTNGRVD